MILAAGPDLPCYGHHPEKKTETKRIFFLFEGRSHTVAQADLKLKVLLLFQPLKVGITAQSYLAHTWLRKKNLDTVSNPPCVVACTLILNHSSGRSRQTSLHLRLASVFKEKKKFSNPTLETKVERRQKHIANWELAVAQPQHLSHVTAHWV
jgi:hypothetical protein